MDIPNNLKAFLKGVKPNDLFYKKYIYPKTSEIKKIRDIASRLFNKDLRPFYDSHSINVNTAVFNFLLEPSKNANFHSNNKNHPLEIELFLSSESLIASFSDGGLYFTRKEVKDYWESKKFHSEKSDSTEEQIGFGMGTKIIYEMADLIFIDNKLNKLYLGLSKGRFLNYKNYKNF